MAKISIIIPIYKAEKVIDRCLDSILAQTYTEWECLLINDGSPDNSERKCEEYKRIDSRFKVYSKENGGPSSARNYGLDKSEGEFICFVDSDDYLGPFYLEHLITPMLTDASIKMTVTGMQQFGSSQKKFPPKATDSFLTSQEAFKQLLSGKSSLIKGWLWNKCFRRDVINNYRMKNELRYCEDLEMLLRMLYEQNQFKIALLNEYDYYYYVDTSSNSLSHDLHNKITMIDRFNACIEPYPDSSEKRVRLIKGGLTQCRALSVLSKLDKDDKVKVREAKKTFIKYFLDVFRSFRKRDVLHITIIILSFRFYRYIINS